MRRSARKVSTAELKAHNTPSDSWVAIRGNVYDVTAWQHDHPGGSAVIQAHTGEDCTAEFDEVGHTNYAVSLLDKYLVGALDRAEGGGSAASSSNAANKITSIAKSRRNDGGATNSGSSTARLAAIVVLSFLVIATVWASLSSRSPATPVPKTLSGHP